MLHTAQRWPGALRADGRAPTDCSTGRRVPARPCWQGAGAVRDAGNRHQSWPCGGSRQILTRRLRSIIHHLKVCEILWFLGSFCSSTLLRVHLFWGGFSTYHDSACYIRQILGKGYHFIVVIIICAFELVRKNPVHSTFSLYMNTWIALHINCFPAPHIFRKPL